jgi:hypothetical protein
VALALDPATARIHIRTLHHLGFLCSLFDNGNWSNADFEAARDSSSVGSQYTALEAVRPPATTSVCVHDVSGPRVGGAGLGLFGGGCCPARVPKGASAQYRIAIEHAGVLPARGHTPCARDGFMFACLCVPVRLCACMVLRYRGVGWGRAGGCNGTGASRSRWTPLSLPGTHWAPHCWKRSTKSRVRCQGL